MKAREFLRKDKTQCYILLALPLIGFFVFTLYPLLWAVSRSFFFYDTVDAHTKFTGLENFKMIFQEVRYWSAWKTTLIYTVVKVPIESFLALLMAFVLAGNLKGSGFFRSVYFFPTMISAVIIGVLFGNLFDYFGFINAFLMKIGILKEGIDWFGKYGTSVFVLVLSSTWGSFGINMLYFLAGLSGIPTDVYEAAMIDGCNKVQIFFKMTIPMVAPVFRTILLLAITGSLKVADEVIALTNGAPGGQTNTVGSYIIIKFIPGFAENVTNVGYGCALSLVTAIIYIFVAVAYSKMSKKMKEVY